MIRREFSSVLGPQPSGEPAVLTHRPGEVSLDNAFALIEGHPNEIFESEFAAWLGHPPSGSRVSIGRVRLRAPLAPTSLTGHHMLPRITQQSHSAAPRRESQIEPMVGTSPPPGLCSFSTQRRCSVDVKTITELRISATKLDHRGWMSENYPSLRPRGKCFLLTSPFIELLNCETDTPGGARAIATALAPWLGSAIGL